MAAIAGPESVDRFALRRGPDGIYRIDGRVIPIADNAALSIDDRQPVVDVHLPVNNRKRFGGAVLGADVEKGELELVPAA